MADRAGLFRLLKPQDFAAAGVPTLLVGFAAAEVLPVWAAACLALACLLAGLGAEWIIRDRERRHDA